MSIYLLYPFLACTLSIHMLYAQNYSEILTQYYVQLTLKFMGIIALGYVGLYALTHDLTLSGLLLTFNYFAIMNANLVYIATSSSYERSRKSFKEKFVFIYLLSCFFISALIFLTNKAVRLEILNSIFFYTSAAFTFFVLMDIFQKKEISKQVRADFQKQAKKQSFKNNSHNNQEINYPDIYHIILDTHAGFAVPEYCDNSFKEALEQRDFHVYTDYMSNYLYTHLSVPSMLNLDYVDNLLKNTNSYSTNELWPFYSDNIFVNQLRKKGYKCNFVVNKHFEVIFRSAVKPGDFCHKNEKSNHLLKLIQLNSLLAILKKLNYPHSAKNDLLTPIKAYMNIKTKKYPQYSLYHMLSPHFPYFFNEKGRKMLRSNYSNNEHYFSYQKYINKKTIEIIDDIKAKMKPNSLIIIHSDHGLQDGSDKPYKVLNAIFFPNKEDYYCIPEKTTLVNLFRCIMNKYFGGCYQLLEDKFYSFYAGSHAIEEIKIEN